MCVYIYIYIYIYIQTVLLFCTNATNYSSSSEYVRQVEMIAENHLSLCSICEVPMPLLWSLLQFEICPENSAVFFNPDFPVRVP
jgi:hypothetical protein